ncbi:hypothetical protein BCR33DRAFT_224398 [Rhizoclosmatium globosum]|uniref:V-SNARE coiled-coil homology domain-containing protein n=1 Tax=Rhizoclosmatium globosum TaxID=329046 RepID=A0A1Y2CBS9_9FUNG|nr:hypothetical protein BCR33DRAFT_224398 [Rhizoclosmatium globosum]|eukprot:ORY44511.1 hypothetical protein BCR33DRAFT_224398 [Rhizoclosmatium globosum]
MQQVSPSPSRANKAAAIQNEVNEVIGVMQNNIEKAVKRGENLESLQNKTSDLRDGAVKFKKGAVKIQNEMWWKVSSVSCPLCSLCFCQSHCSSFAAPLTLLEIL